MKRQKTNQQHQKYLTRSATIQRSQDSDGGDVYKLVLSTEEPVRRFIYDPGVDEYYVGDEVLSHDPAHVRMDFFNSGRAPFLRDHDPSTQVGVIRESTLSDGKMYCGMEWCEDELSAAIRVEVDKKRRLNTSIGYIVHKYRREGDTFTAIDWEPLEGSSVSIPADRSGACFDRAYQPGVIIMDPKKEQGRADTPVTGADDLENDAKRLAAEAAQRINKQNEDALAENKRRIQHIETVAARMGKDHDWVSGHVRSGISIDAFNHKVIEDFDPQALSQGADVKLNERESRQFSICNVLDYLNCRELGINEQKAADAIGFELEVSQSIQKACNIESRGVMVPHHLLAQGHLKRLQTVGTAADGGDLVGTDHLGNELIEALRPLTIALQLGVRTMTGLSGEIKIPKIVSGLTSTWNAGENSPATEDQVVFDHITSNYKDISVINELSRKYYKQATPDAENLARSEIFISMAQGIDKAYFAGAGTANEPQGLATLPGAATFDLSTFTYQRLIKMLSRHQANLTNRQPGMAWVFSHVGFERAAGTTVDPGSGRFVLNVSDNIDDNSGRMGNILGRPAYQTENIPSNLGAGSDESFMILGAHGTSMLLTWGGIDLVRDQFTPASRGAVRYIAYQSADIVHRYPQAFVRGDNLTALP